MRNSNGYCIKNELFVLSAGALSGQSEDDSCEEDENSESNEMTLTNIARLASRICETDFFANS